MRSAIIITALASICLSGCSTLPNTESNDVLARAHDLQATGQMEQATALLQKAALSSPDDSDLRAAYGKALAGQGRLKEAQLVLAQAHQPDAPDATILSAQGAVASQMGDHKTALAYFDRALKVSPDNPTIEANQALARALSGDLIGAEADARRAVGRPNADARVRQVLALVLSMRGQHKEAITVYEQDLTPDQAASNIDLLRKMRTRGS